MPLSAATRIPRRRKQPIPRETAPWYAARAAYTHTVETETAFPPGNCSLVCGSCRVHAYCGNENGLFPGKLLLGMRLASRTRILRRRKQSIPRETAPWYAARNAYTHTAETETAYSTGNCSLVCVSYPVHAYCGDGNSLPSGKLLLGMRLASCARILRNCQRSIATGGRRRSAAGLCRSGRGAPVLRRRVCCRRRAGCRRRCALQCRPELPSSRLNRGSAP